MQKIDELVETCRKVYEKGFVSAYDGNLSVRLDDERILITRSGICKGDVTESDIIEIDYDGKILNGNGKVSTEVKIHLLSYKSRKEVKSVIHCHPIYATAFASVGEGLMRGVFPEFIISIGKVPLCKYGTPSTEQLVNSMKPYIDYAWAMLLENHGAVTLGISIKDAYYKMEKLESSAKILYLARTLSREKSLPLLKVRELYDIAESTYGIKIDPRNRVDY
jgi:L-fuculose-phosphate aldolase